MGASPVSIRRRIHAPIQSLVTSEQALPIAAHLAHWLVMVLVIPHAGCSRCYLTWQIQQWLPVPPAHTHSPTHPPTFTHTYTHATHRTDLKRTILERAEHFASSAVEGAEREWAEVALTLAGAAGLNAFVQENITGPPLAQDWASFLPSSLREKSKVCVCVCVRFMRSVRVVCALA